MPLNESSRVLRDRWPLAFDLEGIPRETAERERLLEAMKQLESQPQSEEGIPDMNSPNLVRNHFAVDDPVEVVTDLNNPPHKNYNPRAAENQYPKMLYNHDSGKVLIVNSEKEEQLAVKKHGFQLKPDPGRDYSRARAGMVAPAKAQVEPREEELIAAELAEKEA